MNAQEFIDAVKLVVRNCAAGDVLYMAENPPERGVTTEAKSRAQWLKPLSFIDEEEICSSLRRVSIAQFSACCI